MSDFKWGTPSPIETAPVYPEVWPSNDPEPGFLVWISKGDPGNVINRHRVPRWAQVSRYQKPGETPYFVGIEAFRFELFTHWMPLPPSLEEMAAKPSLEQILREALDYLEHAPPSLTGTRFLARDEMRDTFKAILKKAGLE